ncbi:MAG TPA: HD domain-containing protein [Patescibacteria group bacterium]|nr:HD domain-containing protein [Patescibacteria group bacterium]
MDDLIAKAATYVQDKLSHESTGHDWWHILRVWNMAKRLAEMYPDANKPLIELAALLHDLGDYKITGSSEGEEEVLRSAMNELGVQGALQEDILQVIDKISYSKNVHRQQTLSLEAQIVQDADRLDAIGAIGVARAFAYGGKAGRPLYSPTEGSPKFYGSVEERRSSTGSTVNHFYEKLLLLKGMLNTAEAKRIAERRHAFMEQFLDEFYSEWNGKS